jgi:hypothetical protein
LRTKLGTELFSHVQEDEAKHHTILCERLEAFGVAFGDLSVHYGLFDSMRDTWHSLTARLSIVHLVHEARGLDVNPGTIARFAKAGDEDSVATLQIIHHDEVTHVATGHRWLCHVAECMTPPRAPVELFREEVRAHFCGVSMERACLASPCSLLFSGTAGTLQPPRACTGRPDGRVVRGPARREAARRRLRGRRRAGGSAGPDRWRLDGSMRRLVCNAKLLLHAHTLSVFVVARPDMSKRGRLVLSGFLSLIFWSRRVPEFRAVGPCAVGAAKTSFVVPRDTKRASDYRIA